MCRARVDAGSHPSIRPANHINHVVESATGRPETKWWRKWSKSGNPDVPHRVVGFDCIHRNAVVQNCPSNGVNLPVSGSRRESRARRGHRRHDGPRRVGIAGAKGRVYTQSAQISGICDHRSLRVSCSNPDEHATQRRKSETKPRRTCGHDIFRGSYRSFLTFFLSVRYRDVQEYSELFSTDPSRIKTLAEKCSSRSP